MQFKSWVEKFTSLPKICEAGVELTGIHISHGESGTVMSAAAKADDKGRILLPVEPRRKFAAKLFNVSARGSHLELSPS